LSFESLTFEDLAMSEYHKIQTVFKRDPATKHKTLLEGEYSLPEFEYLANNKWVFTEKVDGTNIRVYFRDGKVTFGGRTDRAQIPATLVERLNDRFLPQVERFGEVFNGADMCLYGEGYGAKIQKGGGNYRQDQDFVLFDVMVGNWWLQRADVEDVARKMGLDVVPVVGEGTLLEMVEYAKAGIPSTWGDFQAEGYVARPATELKTRAGHRLITKIKCRDFALYR
jgi:ATP-dependent RNA circularization protein (DNA/RNA ligase family)